MVEQQSTTGIACLVIAAQRARGGSKAAGPKAMELEPPEARFNYPERHSLSWSIAIMSILWE